MKYGLYSIRDSKVGFMTVTVDSNDASARRNFEHACSQTNSLFFTHPQDYDLFKVGLYDSDSGVIDPINPPEFLCAATTRSDSNV